MLSQSNSVFLSSGGRNGYGAKLCNIFSTKFIVETSCQEYKRAFKQVCVWIMLSVKLDNQFLLKPQVYDCLWEDPFMGIS